MFQYGLGERNLPPRSLCFHKILPELQMTLSVTRLSLLLAAAGFVAACGGSAPEPVAAPEAPVEASAAEAKAEEAHEDHAGEDHHDHEGEESAGGTAHVHGVADLAITREGNKILGELISPMANFGLSETDGTFTDAVTAELSGLLELEGGDCTGAVPHPMTDNSGDHTDAVVHFVWTCAKPDDARLVRFAGFTAFPGFEKVSTIYITDTAQKAGDLTPSAPELSLK
jgi:hypothetical protein